MTAPRLTHDDRRYIAARLAEGTGYAEIARLLDRPTSTISREVNRNGGPGRYRADQAQRAAAARARRQPGRPAEATPASRDPEAVREFREQLTGIIVHSGLPRAAAAALVYLFTSDTGSMTAAELTAQLRVSPATVSKAVGDLERQQLIRREPDGRRDRYVVDDDVWVQAWLASARMNFMLAEAVRQGASILGDDTPPGNRLRNTGRFLEAVNQEMLQAAERWRQVFEHS